ncbi:hypothetical protein PFISCL1PPCAC_9178, partial [Pristionchus fissidentatus]
TASYEIWNRLFIEKSEFHLYPGSTSEKKALCAQDIEFKCTTGVASSIPGKCIIRSEKKLNYTEAQKFCSASSGKLSALGNDQESQDVTRSSKDPVWVSLGYSLKTWTDGPSFSRFGFCAKENGFFAASDPNWCSKSVA